METSCSCPRLLSFVTSTVSCRLTALVLCFLPRFAPLTQYQGPPGQQTAVGKGQFSTLNTDVVFRSIGYAAFETPGVPFDQKTGVVPNVRGAVV